MATIPDLDSDQWLAYRVWNYSDYGNYILQHTEKTEFVSNIAFDDVGPIQDPALKQAVTLLAMAVERGRTEIVKVPGVGEWHPYVKKFIVVPEFVENYKRLELPD